MSLAKRRQTSRMQVEKTQYGWSIQYIDPDPLKRYLPNDPSYVTKLMKRAEKRALKKTK